jgi:hypothetical protein
MTPVSAGSGWTTGRIIALAAGSVLLLISLALIAGGGILAWADTGQVHSGYVTTTTATYSTRGYALASDAITLHSRGLFVDQIRIRITSSDPSRPLFAGIAATGDVERYLSGVSYTAVDGRDVTDHPGSGVPAAPAPALPWAARAQGTGNLTLTWAVRDGDWTVVVMNAGARPGLSVRAEAGISALALPWLAGEMLGAGLLTGVAAAALIVVPVRMASTREPGATPHDDAHPVAALRSAQLTYSCPFGPSAIASFVSPVAAGPTSTAPVLALNCEPWHGQMITFAEGS